MTNNNTNKNKTACEYQKASRIPRACVEQDTSFIAPEIKTVSTSNPNAPIKGYISSMPQLNNKLETVTI